MRHLEIKEKTGFIFNKLKFSNVFRFKIYAIVIDSEPYRPIVRVISPFRR